MLFIFGCLSVYCKSDRHPPKMNSVSPLPPTTGTRCSSARATVDRASPWPPPAAD